MKSLTSLLVFAAVCSSAHAGSATVHKTTLSCAVVTFDSKMHSNALIWRNFTVKEGEETEILRTNSAVYVIDIDQHESKYDPKDSSLFLSIKSLDGKSIGETSAFWPRKSSNGRVEGFGRLEVTTELAEPNVNTHFMCDNRLLNKKAGAGER
jgi:hypothetical protein